MKKLLPPALLVAALIPAAFAHDNEEGLPVIPRPLPPATCQTGDLRLSSCNVRIGETFVVYGDFSFDGEGIKNVKVGCAGRGTDEHGKRIDPHQGCAAIHSYVVLDEHTIVARIPPSLNRRRRGTHPIVVKGAKGGERHGVMTLS